MEKKLESNYTRMVRAILNKSWRQHLTKHQLYGHLLLITKTTQVRRTRHTGHCWRNRDELISDVLVWTPSYDRAKQDDELEPTYSSSLRIRDVALRNYRKWWTIGSSGERGPGISVLTARNDDDDYDLSEFSWINYFKISPCWKDNDACTTCVTYKYFSQLLIFRDI